MNAAPLVVFENARLGYGRKMVLDNVTCRVDVGECVGLVGPNGAGKTTFLRTVLGFIPPLGGRMAVDKGRRMAYVPQAEELNTYWPITVRETVSLPAARKRVFGRLSPAEKADVDWAMARVGIADLSRRLLSEVSGGQRQKTILAQAISQRPDVLLLDEPTRGLDVVAEKDLLALVLDLQRKESMTVLLVTHALPIPLNFCERVFLFKGGALHTATPEQLVATRKLEEIYGVPFVSDEKEGFRWVAPR